MARGVKEDMRNIYPYRLADGTEKLQVRVRVDGRRLSVICDDYDAAEQARNRLLESRGKDSSSLPPPRQRGGSKKHRTVGTFLIDEWWPTVRPPKNYAGPTRGKARGVSGAKQLPLAQKTRINYAHVLEKYIWDSALGGTDPAVVDAEHISDWITDARAAGATDNVIRQGLKLLSNAFSWAAERPRSTGIQGNPVTSASWPAEVSLKEVEYFEFETTEWIHQWILHTAPANSVQSRRRKALLFGLMQGTAMRPEEARRIEAGHLEEHSVNLPARISKTGRARVIPLWRPTWEEALAYIDDYGLRPSDPLISLERGSGPMTAPAWGKWRRFAFDKAKEEVAIHIVDDDRLLKAVAYDVCRHRWARAQLAALMPPEAVARAMGHDLSTLSRHYAGPISDAARPRKPNEKPYDPEAELTAARDKVAAEIPEAIERAQREGRLGSLDLEIAASAGA